MFKLVLCFFLIAVAVASAGLISYAPAYVGAGAYGAHGPFSVSYTARVDAPRQDVLAVASIPYGHYYHY
ncbi:hypothetical protein RUM43_004292 [Polyplax serrata]|uniref:Uncharacterized protein n=1 Tax=Polyplax serrata TaxID=468196 RepID=A0AAN8XLP0_POLSC